MNGLRLPASELVRRLTADAAVFDAIGQPDRAEACRTSVRTLHGWTPDAERYVHGTDVPVVVLVVASRAARAATNREAELVAATRRADAGAESRTELDRIRRREPVVQLEPDPCPLSNGWSSNSPPNAAQLSHGRTAA